MKVFTRREFLVIGGGLAASTWLGADTVSGWAGQRPAGRRVIYRLSVRGRRGSNAAKRHNANMRFANPEAAFENPAHPGDHSRIVPLDVSEAFYQRLFPSPFIAVADLRHVLGR